MADMNVVESADQRVWIESGGGDRFGFEFTTRSALMTEMVGEPDWKAGSPPADARSVIDRAQKAAVDFARQQGWID